MRCVTTVRHISYGVILLYPLFLSFPPLLYTVIIISIINHHKTHHINDTLNYLLIFVSSIISLSILEWSISLYLKPELTSQSFSLNSSIIFETSNSYDVLGCSCSRYYPETSYLFLFLFSHNRIIFLSKIDLYVFKMLK